MSIKPLGNQSFSGLYYAFIVITTFVAARNLAAEEVAPPPPSEQETPWFLIVGAMNYHAHLDESERMVNREMNGLLGRALPSWQEPTTFKDWSKEWKLWDLYFGVGKDIAPRWTWQATTGAGIGAIHNEHEYHPFAVPLKIEIDFSRADVFLETGLNYYPFGKVPLPEKNAEGNSIQNALRATRPYVSLLTGYTWQDAIGDVRINVPGAGRLARIKQHDSYNLFYVLPRVCLETPINARDSLNLTAGYLFFNSHASEFDSLAVGFFFKHKF